MPSKILQCFAPIIDKRSKVLILGTMPGPTALKKQEYYGFSGNHFWKIIQKFFDVEKLLTYQEKIQLIGHERIALWDVFGSCERTGAADNAIQNTRLNPILELLRKYPNIQTILLNGRTSEKTFHTHFKSIATPAYYVPSTSPAHAGLSFEKKYQLWKSALTKALNP